MLQIIMYTLLSIVGLIALFVISIFVCSGNTPHGNTTIAEKGYIEIGGVRQGYFIRSQNMSNPVILFLHGGPGSPELPLITHTELEKHFTVCYPDQRGAGMSYSPDIDSSTMNLQQMIEDTKEFAIYLQKRFGVNKIILIGHSWGSYLGVKVIEKHPELFSAFIGVGQVTNQVESEKLAYEYILNEATKLNDTKTIKALKNFDRESAGFPSKDYILKVRGNALNKYGVGVERKVSMLSAALKVFYYRGYTFSEKMGYIRGMLPSIEHLFWGVLKDNIMVSSIHFDTPFYIIQGRYDMQVSYSLANEYFGLVNAPKKKFFTFENSAHSPNNEEPEKFANVVREIYNDLSK